MINFSLCCCRLWIHFFLYNFLSESFFGWTKKNYFLNSIFTRDVQDFFLIPSIIFFVTEFFLLFFLCWSFLQCEKIKTEKTAHWGTTKIKQTLMDERWKLTEKFRTEHRIWKIDESSAKNIRRMSSENFRPAAQFSLPFLNFWTTWAKKKISTWHEKQQMKKKQRISSFVCRLLILKYLSSKKRASVRWQRWEPLTELFLLKREAKFIEFSLSLYISCGW